MKATFFKGALVGGLAGAVMAAGTVAVAGTGIGGVFNLGQLNTVDATSDLSGSIAAPQLRVTNAHASGVGLRGLHSATTGVSPGLQGETNSAAADAVAVLGKVNSTAPGASATAVRGINNGTGGSGIGVWGSHQGTGWGVYGQSRSGFGVFGRSLNDGPSSYGVYGLGRYGVVGSGAYSGLWGKATATDGNMAAGVYGESAVGKGVFGRSTNGDGVYGQSTSRAGVVGESTSFDGVYGLAHDTEHAGVSGRGGKFGLWGYGATGVWAASTNGGWAYRAVGHAAQDRTGHGWLKAALYFNPSVVEDKIRHCFNSQLPPDQATTGDCGFTYDHFGNGGVKLSFPFAIWDRFVSVTTDEDGFGPVGSSADLYGTSTLFVTTFYETGPSLGQQTNARFWVLVY